MWAIDVHPFTTSRSTLSIGPNATQLLSSYTLKRDAGAMAIYKLVDKTDIFNSK